MDTPDNPIFFSRGCNCERQSSPRQGREFSHGCNKLDSRNWLSEMPANSMFRGFDVIEVRFKNGRKDFYQASPELDFLEGDIIAVEASPGHDIGIVSLVGPAARLQAKAKKVNLTETELKKAYRKARITDIEKWVAAVQLEQETMIKSRGFAAKLKLEMKISDVEYQGDRTKAIFYYTADDRVDFRELIRVFAEAFGVRVEMRQIGMRQEASKVGGIGTCGRELCCSTWLTGFRTVSTNAARNQQLSLNPQKLAGQCSKLKCCINFENDCYQDYSKTLPENAQVLFTKKGKAVLQKAEILRGALVYSYADNGAQFVSVPADRVKEIQEMNRKNLFPEDLLPTVENSDFVPETTEWNGQSDESLTLDSLTRFDSQKTGRKKKKKKKPNHNNNAEQ